MLVGLLRLWVFDVVQGTTMIERQVGVSLKPLCERTMTGRLPRCSDPDRGSRSAQ